MAKPLTICKLLQNQGFGSRRECESLVAHGLVQWGEQAVEYIDDTFEPLEGQPFSVKSVSYTYRHKAYVMLNKPMGYECSQKPKLHPSVYTLLPTDLRQRGDSGARSGVQCVGRLDQDTTGLLLLSDDGQFIHTYTSPKKHVYKIYQVSCKHAIQTELIETLEAGVILRDAIGDTPEPVNATQVKRISDNMLHMSITEGRYHQVKRMIAAAGNRCEALHRLSVGEYVLPADLALGQWRYVDAL